MRESSTNVVIFTPVPLLQRLTFGKSPKSKQKVFAPTIRPDFVGFPRSIVAPGARREGPSLAHRGSRGIHAAQPLDSLRSPSGPACGCYFAALRFTTIPLGLLTGRLASPMRLVFPKH